MPTSSMTPPVRRKKARPAALPASPGPGHYENRLEKLKFSETAITSSFVIPFELSKAEEVILPGPGEYSNDIQALAMKKREPAYSLRKKTPYHAPGETQSVSPGPAGYHPNFGAVKSGAKHQTQWITTVVDDHKKTSSNAEVYSDGEEYTGPGPGSYALSRELDEGPAYTMAFKSPPNSWAADTQSITPGPAGYTQKSHMGKGMSKSISAKLLHISDRNFGVDADNPGPGKYLSHSYSNPALQRAPAYTWASDPHTSNPVGRDRASFMTGEKNVNVGPASYDDNVAKYKFHGVKQALMVGRPKVKPAESTPGPNYTPRSIARTGQGRTMAGRNDYAWRNKPAVPGVGSYLVGKANDKTKRKGPGYTMRMKPKKNSYDDARGIGVSHDYKDPKLVNNPAFSLVGRKQKKEEFQGPGPGHYNLKASLFKDKKIYRLR